MARLKGVANIRIRREAIVVSNAIGKSRQC
ncbi:hypothetical protein EV698_0976 [Spiribacter vilamensis]|uniref:Uncharacterized protein n=1 Tax=Spiribacter vilamensis TaxID=531306 RepID=A0A4V2GJ30_9GAMM|nr:hypothetical protein EV698_0976 [Spiribacter vilamensis]